MINEKKSKPLKKNALSSCMIYSRAESQGLVFKVNVFFSRMSIKLVANNVQISPLYFLYHSDLDFWIWNFS